MTKTFSRKTRRDLHAEITNQIIAAIEADPARPQMPWRKSGGPLWLPENAFTHAPYNGINIVNLWVAAERRSFSSHLWATYKQWQDLGAQVRKGAKSHPIVFYSEYEAEPNPDEPDDDGKRRILKSSNVFNAAEVDGFELPPSPDPLEPIARMEHAERFICATGARVEEGGERAFYRPATDHIQMPDGRLFIGTDTMTRDESWYAVLLHELTHYAEVRIMPRLHDASAPVFESKRTLSA